MFLSSWKESYPYTPALMTSVLIPTFIKFLYNLKGQVSLSFIPWPAVVEPPLQTILKVSFFLLFWLFLKALYPNLSVEKITLWDLFNSKLTAGLVWWGKAYLSNIEKFISLDLIFYLNLYPHLLSFIK